MLTIAENVSVDRRRVLAGLLPGAVIGDKAAALKLCSGLRDAVFERRDASDDISCGVVGARGENETILIRKVQRRLYVGLKWSVVVFMRTLILEKRKSSEVLSGNRYTGIRIGIE